LKFKPILQFQQEAQPLTFRKASLETWDLLSYWDINCSISVLCCVMILWR